MRCSCENCKWLQKSDKGKEGSIGICTKPKCFFVLSNVTEYDVCKEWEENKNVQK